MSTGELFTIIVQQLYYIYQKVHCFDRKKNSVDVPNFFPEPSPPQNVEANAINSTAVLVKWKAPLYPNGPLTLYTILYEKTQYFGSDDPRMESVKPNVTEKTIGGLSPFTNYTVKVKVLNVLTGTESKAVIVVTMSAGKRQCLTL